MNLGLTRAVTWVTRRIGPGRIRDHEKPTIAGPSTGDKSRSDLLLALNAIACGDTTAADGPIAPFMLATRVSHERPQRQRRFDSERRCASPRQNCDPRVGVVSTGRFDATEW